MSIDHVVRAPSALQPRIKTHNSAGPSVLTPRDATDEQIALKRERVSCQKYEKTLWAAT